VAELTRLPAPAQLINRADGPAYEPAPQCHHPTCDIGLPLHKHHIVRRSFSGATDYVSIGEHKLRNVVHLCWKHHEDVTVGRCSIEFDSSGPHWVWVRHTAEGDERVGPLEAGCDQVGPGPGQDCPTCGRRVPHPRKPTSPKTKTMGIRVPLDVADELEEIYAAAGKHLGCYEEPGWRYKVLLTSLVLLLQDARPGERAA